MPQQVDYAALAAQARAKSAPVDYAALAEQARKAAATPSDPLAGKTIEDVQRASNPIGAMVSRAVNRWGEVGPHAVVEGVRDISRGNYAAGGRQVVSGAALTALPMVAPQAMRAFAAAPVATTVTAGAGVVGGVAGQQAAQHAASAMGATEDQAGLVGDVTGLVTGGATAALGSRMPKSLASMYEPGLRAGATKKVEQALGPTKERFKAIAARITPEILKRRLGGSRQGLIEKAQAAATTAGEQIDDAIQQFGARPAGTQPVVDALETAKGEFRAVVQRPLADALKRQDTILAVKNGMADVMVEYESRPLRQLEQLQQILTDLGPNVTVKQLIAVRRKWDDVVAQAGGYAHRAGSAIGVPLQDQSEAWAKREATTAIRALLAEKAPELSAVNAEFAFWKNLDDVLTQTVQRTTPQKGGLRKAVAEAAGAAAGSSRGIGAAWMTAKLAGFVEQVFTSPRWQFVDARMRNALADALASGSQGRTQHTLGRIALTHGILPAPTARALAGGAPMSAVPDPRESSP